MKSFVELPISEWMCRAVSIWKDQWFLLTSGTMENYNMMTVAWGSIGFIWNRPFVQVLVRPQRYTYEFMEKFPTFTLCSFPENYRKDLQLLGTISGRDGNKLSQTSLSLKPSKYVDAPGYNEASLIIECQKIYFQDIHPEGFLFPDIMKNYPKNDFHRIYFGEILGIHKLESP